MNMKVAQVYTSHFFHYHHSASNLSARAVIPLILELYRPNSAVDVGCGLGAGQEGCYLLMQYVRRYGAGTTFRHGIAKISCFSVLNKLWQVTVCLMRHFELLTRICSLLSIHNCFLVPSRPIHP